MMMSVDRDAIRRSPIVAMVGLMTILMVSGVSTAADVSTQAAAPAAESEASTDWKGLGQGDWLLRARIMGLFPQKETSEVGLIGGRIETPAQLLPDGEIGYFVTDHVSIELQGGVVVSKPKILDSLVGDFEIGSIWTAALAGSAQYHFRPAARFNPYVGFGASVSWPVHIDPAPGVADFTIERLVSPMLQVGTDYQVSENVFANASVKYSLVPGQTYSGGGATFKSDLDMVVVGAGFGYRF